MKTFLLALIAWALLAFMPIETPSFVGVYGSSDSDPVQIRLTIHADHTYSFQDYSNPKRKINSSGSWSEKGNKVHLVDATAKTRFHRIWTFHNEGKQAKSRKGMSFYTLCRVK